MIYFIGGLICQTVWHIYEMRRLRKNFAKLREDDAAEIALLRGDLDEAAEARDGQNIHLRKLCQDIREMSQEMALLRHNLRKAVETKNDRLDVLTRYMTMRVEKNFTNIGD